MTFPKQLQWWLLFNGIARNVWPHQPCNDCQLISTEFLIEHSGKSGIVQRVWNVPCTRTSITYVLPEPIQMNLETTTPFSFVIWNTRGQFSIITYVNLFIMRTRLWLAKEITINTACLVAEPYFSCCAFGRVTQNAACVRRLKKSCTHIKPYNLLILNLITCVFSRQAIC